MPLGRLGDIRRRNAANAAWSEGHTCRYPRRDAADRVCGWATRSTGRARSRERDPRERGAVSRTEPHARVVARCRPYDGERADRGAEAMAVSVHGPRRTSACRSAIRECAIPARPRRTRFVLRLPRHGNPSV